MLLSLGIQGIQGIGFVAKPVTLSPKLSARISDPRTGVKVRAKTLGGTN